jgi:hypothetical protein
MASRLSRNNIRKCCALVAAELILPPLAHAGKHRALFENDDNRWGDYDRAKENGASRWGDHDRDNDKDRPIPVVPEANSGWVLVPFFAAVLVFSSRRLLRAKVEENNGC